MMTAEGELLENACPIQEQFPDYALLDPQLFDLGALQDAEGPLLEAAAKELGVDVEFETTISVIAATSAPAALHIRTSAGGSGCKCLSLSAAITRVLKKGETSTVSDARSLISSNEIRAASCACLHSKHTAM